MKRKYAYGLFFSLSLALLGLVLEWVVWPEGLPTLRWPTNMWVGVAFAAVLVLVHLLWRRHAVVQWLVSVPTALVSVGGLAFWVLLMGFVPQEDEAVASWMARLGLSHVAASWPMLLAQVFLLSALGLATLRRLWPFRGKNIGFFLNHAGLWLALTAGILGAGDVYRLRVPLTEGQGFSSTAYDASGQKLHLPFALALTDFEMELYTPELALYHLGKKQYLPAESPFVQANPGATVLYDQWRVQVLDFLPTALRDAATGDYQPAVRAGAVQAARVMATHRHRADTLQGWITNGSFVLAPRRMGLSDSMVLVLQPAEAKVFRSRVVWKRMDNTTDSALVEVNKPLKVGAWKIYQVSYNTERGRWSDLSVLEAITDYWLPLVYLGLAMMLAGAVYLYWQGREFRPKPLSDTTTDTPVADASQTRVQP